MKSTLLKRVAKAEQNAAKYPRQDFRKICEKMTIEELEECVDENTSTERFWEIFKEAAQR